jgi:adenine-specific DNA-methyltransferase
MLEQAGYLESAKSGTIVPVQYDSELAELIKNENNISHWSQWVDYWAIDWDYKNDTFHNQYQSYRSRQNPTIELSSSHTYEHTGLYSVVVKVIDILGNDTTKLLTVEI